MNGREIVDADYEVLQPPRRRIPWFTWLYFGAFYAGCISAAWSDDIEVRVGAIVAAIIIAPMMRFWAQMAAPPVTEVEADGMRSRMFRRTTFIRRQRT